MGHLKDLLAKGLATIGKRMLPKSTVLEIQQYRGYTAEERRLYLRIRIANQFVLAKPTLSSLPTSVHAICFVCFGNIMRSPMCSALLTRELTHLHVSHVSVSSAGLNAIPGNPAHAWAIEAASELGISLHNHRAQLLTSQMVNGADLIFVMDYHNLVQILTRWPDAESKIFLLRAHADPRYRAREIPDPYYLDLEGTRHCYATLARCIHNLARSISPEPFIAGVENRPRFFERERSFDD